MAFSVIFRVPGQMSPFRGHFPPVSRFCAPLCRAGNSREEKLTAGSFSSEIFYQKCPCPRKCPNGHKNGICGCFYPKSAISCRDCPTNPPKSLCTPPAKSYKFVSANPCKTDAGRINKYDYPGCVGGSFWNFIRFRDFPETLQNLSVIFAHARCHCPLSALACHLPRPGESFLVGEALAFRDVFQQNQISFIENDTSLPRALLPGELASVSETERF